MVDLCTIRCRAFYRCNMETMGIHVIFYFFYLIVFVNMFILKSLMIMMGQLIGIFVTMFFKMEMKKIEFICDGL